MLNILRHARWRARLLQRFASTSCTVGHSELVLRTNEIARFADGSAVVECGDSSVLATCVTKYIPDIDPGGIPLNVDFQRSAAAVGRIPTNYLRRELGQSDEDILTGRVIDRAIRPMIQSGWVYSTNISIKPLALDDEGDGVILGLNAAACALNLSSVPLIGPVAGVRVGMVDGKLQLNPARAAIEGMSMVFAGTHGRKTVMIEMEGPQIPSSILEEAFDMGLDGVENVLQAMDRLQKAHGKPKTPISVDKEQIKFMKQIENLAADRIEYILTDQSHDKTSRDRAIREVELDVLSAMPVRPPPHLFHKYVKTRLRELSLQSGIRCDGRRHQDFRPISIQVDVYKKLHGSSLFQRGQTQVMSTVTFDSPASAFHPDSVSQMLGAQQRKSFMLHYEFPGFATNEFNKGKGTNRREIGHGFLAEKSLKHVIPEEFPYAIRVSSQVLESNGSSSMASACSGSLALYDAGVELKAPVAGVAIGLITDSAKPDDKYLLLTDILGIEDYAGDMDFKIAGTSNGFTAMQMDIKVPGITRKQLSEAVEKGKQGVEYVLDKMAEVQPKPREKFKETVPVIETMQLEPYKRAIIFRNQGFVAKAIEAETRVRISADDDSHIQLVAPSRERLEKAKERLTSLLVETKTEDYDFGKLLKAEVVELVDRGLVIRLQSGGPTYLMPNSQLSSTPIKHPSATGIKVGQKVTVQWLGRDPRTGAVRFSMRMSNADPAIALSMEPQASPANSDSAMEAENLRLQQELKQSQAEISRLRNQNNLYFHKINQMKAKEAHTQEELVNLRRALEFYRDAAEKQLKGQPDEPLRKRQRLHFGSIENTDAMQLD
ncbi:unnamed protein product, partial [Mesorhabditis spiculigera]